MSIKITSYIIYLLINYNELFLYTYRNYSLGKNLNPSTKSNALFFLFIFSTKYIYIYIKLPKSNRFDFQKRIVSIYNILLSESYLEKYFEYT